MFNSKYMKCVALTDLLGLFATMFSAIGDLQNYTFAQITSYPQKHDDSGDNDQSSSNGPSSNADDGEGSDGSESSESSSAIDESESQDTDGSERQDSAADESSDSDTTESNSLMEQITDKVNQDFAGVGMPSLWSG
jgi:cytoskeletal protein RodZ